MNSIEINKQRHLSPAPPPPPTHTLCQDIDKSVCLAKDRLVIIKPPLLPLPSESQSKRTRPRDDITKNIDEGKITDNPQVVVETKAVVRYCVASLGLLCAIVTIYAQTVFCIAIVEMVKIGNGQQDTIVNNQQHLGINLNTNQTTTTTTTTGDETCPIDLGFKSFYDGWRFNDTHGIIASPSSHYHNQHHNYHHHHHHHHHDNSSSSIKDIDIDIDINIDRFNWDASQQGILLGAAAFGTAPLQVLGGRMAEIHGAKWVLFASGFGTAITNFLIPRVAHYSYYLLIVLRILMGISQSGMEPALMCLFAEWLAPVETSFFISMLLFAICIGSFLGSLCSGYLLTLGLGWPITYYVASIISFVWSILWLVFATSKPHNHRLISDEELNYIMHKQKRAATEQQRPAARLRGSTKEVLSTATNKVITTTTTTNNGINNNLGRRSSNLLAALLANNDDNDPRMINTNSVSLLDNHDHDHGQDNVLEQYKRTESPIVIPSAPIPIPIVIPIVDSRGSHSTVKGSKQQQGAAPWRNILTTPQVWVFIITKISVRWCADVLTIELPTYLANVLHLSIKSNGLINSISSALFAIFSFISGCAANRLLRSRPRNLTKTNIRKLIQAIASFGGAIGLFLMTTYDCNLIVTISMLMFLSCCLVFGTGGELQIPFDMTSEYPGTLHGLACTLSVSGWLAPPLIGLVLSDKPNSRSRWNIVWYSTGIISLIGGVVFVLFADARPIDFNHDNDDSLSLHKRQQQQKLTNDLKSNQIKTRKKKKGSRPTDNSINIASSAPSLKPKITATTTAVDKAFPVENGSLPITRL